MSRIKTFMDFQNFQADDVVSILDEVGTSVQVWRYSTPSGVAGFDEELELSYLRTILAYFQVDRSRPQENNSEAGRVTEIYYLGITNDTDVRMNDIWKHKGKEYRIISIDNANYGKTEVRLERKV